MDFYLINEAENYTFHLPVNPGEITVAGDKRIETVEIVNIGEVDFPAGDRINEIRFSSFLPGEYDSCCRYSDLPDPQEALQLLLAWKDAGKPVRLLITESPVNALVLIRTVGYSIRGGDVGDIYYDLVLRAWREVKVRTAAEAPGTGAGGANAPRPRPDTRPVPKVYVVKPGDSLYKIAKMQLGDGSKWQDIYNNNRSVVGPDPNLIQPGMKLVMPA